MPGAILVVVVGILLALPSCHAPRPEPFDRVFLVTIDTLRADHLGSHGYPRKTSEFLDGLASDGVQFSNAYATMPTTTPSHVSMLTSLYPFEHNVRMNSDRLHASLFTLPDLFGRAGFDTAAFTSVQFLKAGLVDRFDSFDAHPVRGIAARRDPKVYYRVASKTIDRALEWTADKSAADRFFVWIHVFDPHQYSASTPPPAEHLEAMRIDAGEDGRSALDLIGEMHDIPPTVRKRTSLSIGNIQRYDGQILFVDRELRRLFEGLAERGLTENSLWIVTADHGEGLGNHGYMYHGRYLYNEHLRVPLIFYSPRQGFPQRRISGPVTHVDILPTVAELMDLTPEPKGYATSGRSLVPLMLGKDGDASPRYVFSQRTPKLDRRSTFEDGDLYSIQDERFKYIYRSAGTSEFYDLELDPQELHNLIEAPSAARDRLRTVLDERFTPRFHSPIPAEGQVAPVDPATREELRALGYIE